MSVSPPFCSQSVQEVAQWPFSQMPVVQSVFTRQA
jgi:hypothetical protein